MKLSLLVVPAALMSLVALTLPAACGSSGETASDADAGLSTSSYCPDDHARHQRCKQRLDYDCATRATCYEFKMRAGVAAPLEQCLLARDCETDEAPCFLSTAAPLASLPVPAAFTAACTARQQACTGEGSTFDVGYCGSTTALFTDESIGLMQACLEGPCNQIESCVNKVTDDLRCD